jgi:hypothetical protein
MSRTKNETKQTQFRLLKKTLDDLDLIAECLSITSGRPPNRTDAVRYAAHETAKKIQKKMQDGG